jgi:hypothetical protein
MSAKALPEELLEDRMNERTTVHGRDGLGVARVLELAQAEDAAEEVRKRARGPLLEARRRARVLQIVCQLRPAADGARPLRELALRARPGGAQAALETGGRHQGQLLDGMTSGACSQQLAEIELRRGGGGEAGRQPPLERLDVLPLTLQLQNERRRLLRALTAWV